MTPRLVHSAGPVPAPDPARAALSASPLQFTRDALAMVTLAAPAGETGRALAWAHLLARRGQRFNQLRVAAETRRRAAAAAALRTALPDGDAA